MSSRYRGTRTEMRALNAWIKLNRALEGISRGLHRAMEAQGLTIGQFGVLEVLTHLGPLTASDLATRLLRSPGNITTVVDNLEREGLVERRRDREDRRVVTLSATPRGQQIIRNVLPGHVQRVTAAMSSLSTEEQEILAELCRKLHESQPSA